MFPAKNNQHASGALHSLLHDLLQKKGTNHLESNYLWNRWCGLPQWWCRIWFKPNTHFKQFKEFFILKGGQHSKIMINTNLCIFLIILCVKIIRAVQLQFPPSAPPKPLSPHSTLTLTGKWTYLWKKEQGWKRGSAYRRRKITKSFSKPNILKFSAIGLSRPSRKESNYWVNSTLSMRKRSKL